jgi:basic membrane protein A
MKAPFVACLVTGTGGPTDAAYNRLAAAGLKTLEGRGVNTRTVSGSSQSDYVRALGICAKDGAAVTIGVGYGMATAVDQVATAYPWAAFAIVDVDVRTLTHRPPNVTGLLFRHQEAGYLAGYAAGLWAAKVHGGAVGSVGGLEIPPVEQALAGFRFGAKRAAPGLRVLNAYAGDFTVAAKCQHRALSQIADGSVVEFQVAGSCGAGVIAAAQAKGVMGVGFATDQSTFGPQLLTSAVERADVAVEAAVRAARSHTLAGGTNVFFDAGNGGIDVGAWSPRAPESIRRAVDRQLGLLRAGKIAGIPTTLP